MNARELIEGWSLAVDFHSDPPSGPQFPVLGSQFSVKDFFTDNRPPTTDNRPPS
jgi:hypothetical protein